MIRYNTSSNRMEFYANAMWQEFTRRAGDTMFGNLLFSPDNTVDIGASNTTRFRNIYAGTSFVAPDGSASAPSIVFAGSTNTGFFRTSTETGFLRNGSQIFSVQSGAFRLTAAQLQFGTDLPFSRESAATLQMGDDAASPIAQTFKGPDGSGTDKNGGDLNISAGANTGTGNGGSLNFKTSTPLATGSTNATLTTRMSINGVSGTVAISNIVGTATLLTGFTSSNTLSGVGIGSGLSMSGTNLTAQGASGSTNYRSSVIALTMTGTNVDANQIDWLKTNVAYRITATGNIFFGDAVCINVPDTNSDQSLKLHIVQDSTGGRSVTFTNSIFAGVNGTFAITTNANAWDLLSLVNSVQTNGNIAVLPSNYLHR
jgi:hypothetical protein